MTVQELIEKLEKVQDKSAPVGFHSFTAKAGYRSITRVEEVLAHCIDKTITVVQLQP